jgi:hypothetical protein
MSHKNRFPQTGHRPKNHAPGTDDLRRHIAAEAGRIMAEEGVSDFHTAKRKAASRLGLHESTHLPGNDEVDAALQDHLRLFHATRLAHNVNHLRGLAADAMRFLAKFEPRLVGPVLSGSVTSTSMIELHLTADMPDEIGFWLDQHGIPYEHADRRLRFGGDRHQSFPAYLFSADGVTVELCVFERREVREPPLSPVDGKPMKRANLRELEALLHGTIES